MSRFFVLMGTNATIWVFLWMSVGILQMISLSSKSKPHYISLDPLGCRSHCDGNYINDRHHAVGSHGCQAEGQALPPRISWSPQQPFELGVIISMSQMKKRSWEVKTSQIISHLIQRGTKWEFTFTVWRVWGQAFTGADSPHVLSQFKVSNHLASSLCPSLPRDSSACPPRLYGCVPICLSSPFLPGK